MDAFSLGQYLREAREKQELSLDQAETTLKIRRYILEGFESGNFTILEDSPIQIRGFLRNYARFLSLDEDIVIQYYESATQPSPRRSRRNQASTASANTPRPPDKRKTDTHPTLTQSSRPKSRQRGGLGILRLLLIAVIGGVTIGVIAFVATELLGINDLSNVTNGEISTEVAAGEFLPTLTATLPLTPTIQSNATLIPRAAQNYLGQPILVTVEFFQRTWIRVVADNTEVFSGTVRPNELILEYPANNSLIVTASNAEALLITYNGQPQSPFGVRGQSIEIIFRPQNDISVNALGAVALAATETEERILPLLDLTPVIDETEETTNGIQTPAPTALPLIPEGVIESPTSNTTGAIPTLDAIENTSTIEGTAVTSIEASTSTPTDEVTLLPSATPTSDVALPPRITPTSSTPPKSG